MSYDLGSAVGKIVVDGSGASKGFNVAGAAASGFFKIIDNKVESIKKLGENLLKIGATTSAGLGVAINAAADFEVGLSAIEAVSGATAKEMDLISEAALRIGSETSFNATEAASAMEELVKAGISVEDTLNGAADATVSLAAAGEIALPQAAEIASAAMNNFNLNGKDMPRIADLIAGAANASAISVGEFGYSLQQSGAVANLAGMSFDDLAVAIALMGNAGIKGSDAGTSLKTMLSSLIPTTNKQINLFKELGIITKKQGNRFFDAKGNLKDFADVAEILNQSFGFSKISTEKFNEAVRKGADPLDLMRKAATKNGKQLKLQRLETAFGSDAIRAAAVMAKNGATGFNEMSKAMGKVKASDVAAKRLDNLKGSIEEFKGAMETASITIGMVFIPIVRKVVDFATKMVNTFNKLPEPVKKAIAIFVGLVAVISTLVGGIITLSMALAPLIVNFIAMAIVKQIGSIITAAAAAMLNGAGAAGVYSAAMSRANLVIGRFVRIGKIFVKTAKMMRAAWLLMTGPIGIAIGIILALVGLGKLLYDNWKPFHDLVDKIVKIIKDKFNAAMDEASRLMAMFKRGFKGLKNNTKGNDLYDFFYRLGAGVKVAWNELQKLGKAFKKYVIPAFKEAKKAISSEFMKAWKDVSKTAKEELGPALKELWEVVKNDLIPALKDLNEAIKPLMMAFLKLSGQIGGKLLKLFFQIAMVTISKVLPAVIKFASKVITTLIPAISGIAKFLIKVVAAIIDFSKWILEKAKPAIDDLSESLTDGTKGFQEWLDKVKPGFEDFVESVKTAFTDMKETITSAIDWIKEKWDKFWNTFGPLFQAIWNLIVAILQTSTAVVKILFNKFVNWLKQKWNKAWNSISNYVGPKLEYVKNKVKSGLNSVRNFFNSGINKIKSLWNRGWTALNNATGGKLTTLKNKITSAINKIKSFFSGSGGWLTKAGSDIIQGLINGITSKTGSLTDKINNLTAKIKSIPNKLLQMGSPSKVFYKIGTNIMAGWINGIKKGAPKLYKYMKKLSMRIADLKVSKSRKTAVQKLLLNYTTSLDKLNKKLDKTRDKLKEAVDKYKSLVKEAKEYKAQIRDSVIGDITSIDIREGTSGNDFVSELEERKKKAQEFLDNIKKLKKAGLDKGYLEEIVNAGVEGGGATAEALANSMGSIEQINKLRKQLKAIGNKIGQFGVNEFKKAGINAAKGLVAGLKKKESTLVKAITALAKKMVAALKKQLKIKSPSQVMAGVGIDTIQGIMQGINEEKDKLNGLIENVGSGMASALANPGSNGISSTYVPKNNSSSGISSSIGDGNKSFNITVNNPVKEPASRSLTNAASRLVYLGARED